MDLLENDAVWPDSLLKTTLPLGSLQRPYIAPLRVVTLLEFINGTLNSSPKIARQPSDLLLSLGGGSTRQFMFYVAPGF